MCINCTPQFDVAQSDGFAETMLQHYNGAALTLMISIGYKTKLFDVMAEMSPANSEAIAEAAGLNERYVREWLGAMVTGQIVNYDSALGTYHLPEERAVWLTRRAAPNNLAVTAAWIPVLSSVEEDIIECFKQGGGVPYESYKGFHQVMAEESQQTVVAPLLDTILPIAPAIQQKLEDGCRVLDFGCGSGRALMLLAEAYPKSEFYGYDLSAEAIESANGNASGLSNLHFNCRDVAQFTNEARFDVVFTFDAIHDQADPQTVLNNIYQVLQPDGIYLMQEIAGTSDLEKDTAHPVGPFLYTISCMHCMSVSLAQGGLGLGAMWGEQVAREMLATAGFTKIDMQTLEHDIQNHFYIIQK